MRPLIGACSALAFAAAFGLAVAFIVSISDAPRRPLENPFNGGNQSPPTFR